jgi:pimeloyl-ACP methyl ester carboxylesterase
MSTKPTFVFVPGAWHQPSAFKPSLDLLTSAGYEVEAVSLPSVGTVERGEPATTSFQPDVDAIRKAILSHIDQGKDVIVVMHSYGGIPGSHAVQGLSKDERQAAGKKGSVVKLIYIAAMLWKAGTAVWEGVEEGVNPWPHALRIEVSAAAQCSAVGS